jgi:hypothetical protein
MGPCLSTIRSVVHSSAVKSEQSTKPSPPVLVSMSQKGPNVRVSSLVISGKGAACATDAIEFDRIYFEVVLKSPGRFGVGVSQQVTDPSAVFDKEIGDNKISWATKSDMLAATPEVGDVIGVFYDQSESPKMSFSLNGKPLGDLYDVPKPRSEIKIKGGRVYPAAYVDGASLEFRFRDGTFAFPPPKLYQTVISVREMI